MTVNVVMEISDILWKIGKLEKLKLDIKRKKTEHIQIDCNCERARCWSEWTVVDQLSPGRDLIRTTGYNRRAKE